MGRSMTCTLSEPVSIKVLSLAKRFKDKRYSLVTDQLQTLIPGQLSRGVPESTVQVSLRGWNTDSQPFRAYLQFFECNTRVL